MNISLIQIPWDSGYYDRRMGKGPIHLIEKGLVKHLETSHNVELTELQLPNQFFTEVSAAKELIIQLSNEIQKIRNDDRFPVILAGNCNSAIGAVNGLNQPGIIWFDAHGDFNTPETTESGFFDAMGLSILTGNSWKQWRHTIPGFKPVTEQNVIQIGARDLDKEERKLLRSSDVTSLSVSAIRKNPQQVLSQSLRPFAKSCREIYLHIDLDVFDPKQLKANQFYADNGLLIDEVNEIIGEICAHSKIGAITLASYDPAADSDKQGYEIVKTILDNILTLVNKKEQR